MKEQYYGEYFARAIIFTNNIDKLLNRFETVISKLDVNMSELLETIHETILLYASNGYVTDKAKGNIYFFLHFISRMQLDSDVRQICSMYRKEMFDMLNGERKDSRINEFYRNELAIRKGNQVYLNRTLTPEQKLQSLIPKVNDGIVFDTEVLFSHLDESEEDFDKHSIHYISSPHYVESSRYLIYEYPGLMEEPNFKNRLCTILESRVELSKQYRKNIFKRFTLTRENQHIGTISYSRDNKKLYKQVVGR